MDAGSTTRSSGAGSFHDVLHDIQLEEANTAARPGGDGTHRWGNGRKSTRQRAHMLHDQSWIRPTVLHEPVDRQQLKRDVGHSVAQTSVLSDMHSELCNVNTRLAALEGRLDGLCAEDAWDSRMLGLLGRALAAQRPMAKEWFQRVLQEQLEAQVQQAYAAQSSPLLRKLVGLENSVEKLQGQVRRDAAARRNAESEQDGLRREMMHETRGLVNKVDNVYAFMELLQSQMKPERADTHREQSLQAPAGASSLVPKPKKGGLRMFKRQH